MGNKDTRNKLIQTAKLLLMEETNLDNLTARNISTAAGTNLAMINYCFKSKDELLKIAVDEIIAEEFKPYTLEADVNLTAKERLRGTLLQVCKAMIKFKTLTKLPIPYLLLEEDITLPLDILPFIKSHYGNRKGEAECRLIAFGLVYTMQLIFYRAEEFYRYSGLDIEQEQQMEELLDMQIDLLLI